MEQSSRRIARKILFIHLLLLCGVLAMVYFASRQIYYSARQQAIVQASSRQELLASQASRGIEDFYATILSDLDLARRSQTDEPTTQASLSPPAAAVRERAFFPYLFNQLNGRVSALFIYDRQAHDPARSVRIVELRSTPDQSISSPAMLEETRTVASLAHAWLSQTDHPVISPLLRVKPSSPLLGDSGGGGGVNLVCVPLNETRRSLLVAVVPSGEIQSRFLPSAAERKNTSSSFMDENLAVVASSTPALAGTNLKEIEAPIIKEFIEHFSTYPAQETRVFDEPFTIAGATLEPRLITVQPVSMAGQKWCLLVSSPMADVDAVVRDLFSTALDWAAFVVISVTAILISTATQMIRGRLRMERLRHELLSREITQARQIQLNWLPSRHSAGPALDIAAMNRPAHHISGDFYNWFDLPDGRQVVTIGDVTGHGMAAAFLMATTQLLVRTTMPRVGDPGLCLEEVNRQLCTQVFHGQFVTMLILVLDLQHGVVDIATAGHYPPLINHGSGYTSLPLKSHLVLAVDDSQRYATERFTLLPRASMLLLTDGVLDAQDPTGDRFNMDRLLTALDHRCNTAQAMIDAVAATVVKFQGSRELDDDLTLVAIQWQPTTPPPDSTSESAHPQEITATATP